MSGVWNMAEEFDRLGLSPGPDKSVCCKHFKDDAISRFIKGDGLKGICDYCGSNRKIISLEELMKFLMETVSYYYADPVEFASFNSAEGGYMVEHTDAWEILQEDLGLEVNDTALFNDMEEWIDFNRTWADEKAMYSLGHYSRPDSWAHFCYLLKHKVRYLFQAYQDSYETYQLTPIQILKEVEKMMTRYHLAKRISAQTPVFRCRQHSENVCPTKIDDMCAPPVEFCINPNRMSPAGISMFYCAFDIETTIQETLDEKWEKSAFTTGQFTLKEDVNVIDLSALPSSPSVFDRSKRKKRSDLMFLKSFVKDLTKPIDRDGKAHIEYVPTQVITEFFRFMLGQKIDGIIYPSSKYTGHTAIVLFYDHFESKQKLDFHAETLITKPIKS